MTTSEKHFSSTKLIKIIWEMYQYFEQIWLICHRPTWQSIGWKVDEFEIGPFFLLRLIHFLCCIKCAFCCHFSSRPRKISSQLLVRLSRNKKRVKPNFPWDLKNIFGGTRASVLSHNRSVATGECLLQSLQASLLN